MLENVDINQKRIRTLTERDLLDYLIFQDTQIIFYFIL